MPVAAFCNEHVWGTIVASDDTSTAPPAVCQEGFWSKIMSNKWIISYSVLRMHFSIGHTGDVNGIAPCWPGMHAFACVYADTLLKGRVENYRLRNISSLVWRPKGLKWLKPCKRSCVFYQIFHDFLNRHLGNIWRSDLWWGKSNPSFSHHVKSWTDVGSPQSQPVGSRGNLQWPICGPHGSNLVNWM